jgi:t-SNARE complex subunit (syntaxin)
MKILLNSDYNISGTQEMRQTLKAAIKEALDRFSEHITRLEVKFRDESSDQCSENDRRNVVEARLKGMQPLDVTRHEDTFTRYTP